MCVSYTKITGNVKNKHKQYDHWHSHDFSTGGKAREWWGNFLHINFVLFSLSGQSMGGGGGPGDSGVARIC